MKICIGITSYLPDSKEVRNVRSKRLKQLISKCNEFFNFDIIIIAQNWKDFNIKGNNVIIDYYKTPLGITPARIKLREKFLSLDYDYMIMMDDDTDLCGTKESYENYINKIIENKKDFYWVNNYYIRMCCISKSGFIKIGFDDSIVPEKGLGWEDVIFCKKCRKYLSSMVIDNNNLLDTDRTKTYCKDVYSTWDNCDTQLQRKNGVKTRELRSKFEAV